MIKLPKEKYFLTFEICNLFLLKYNEMANDYLKDSTNKNNYLKVFFVFEKAIKLLEVTNKKIFYYRLQQLNCLKKIINFNEENKGKKVENKNTSYKSNWEIFIILVACRALLNLKYPSKESCNNKLDENKKSREELDKNNIFINLNVLKKQLRFHLRIYLENFFPKKVIENCEKQVYLDICNIPSYSILKKSSLKAIFDKMEKAKEEKRSQKIKKEENQIYSLYLSLRIFFPEKIFLFLSFLSIDEFVKKINKLIEKIDKSWEKIKNLPLDDIIFKNNSFQVIEFMKIFYDAEEASRYLRLENILRKILLGVECLNKDVEYLNKSRYYLMNKKINCFVNIFDLYDTEELLQEVDALYLLRIYNMKVGKENQISLNTDEQDLISCYFQNKSEEEIFSSKEIINRFKEMIEEIVSNPNKFKKMLEEMVGDSNIGNFLKKCFSKTQDFVLKEK